MTEWGEILFWWVGAWLAVAGLYGMATSRNLISMIVCLTVFQSSVWIFLLTVGYRTGGTAPIYGEIPAGTETVDPVMQALSVTDVVVGAAVVAILLALAVQIHKRFGTLDPDNMKSIRG